MFSKNFQRKYALTDQGLRNVRKGAFWTVIVNLVVMAGMGILYLLMGGFMGTLTEGASLPGAAPVRGPDGAVRCAVFRDPSPAVSGHIRPCLQ